MGLTGGMGERHEVVIVGAGFGGMGAAIQFQRLGIGDVVLLEREDDLGGTWHVNRYPGLSVDIASVTYSYSFEPNPYWSRLYAPGEEIKRYADHVADRYGLRGRMRFGVTVEGATWDDDAGHWTVRIRGGEPIEARYLVTATGFLSQPKVPDIEGIDRFAGEVVHSARWDDRVALDGRRVGLIGTGATAVQLVPQVAKRAADLTVYQRTPVWVLPKLDRPIPPRVQRLFARRPVLQRLARLVTSGIYEAMTSVAVLNHRPFGIGSKVAERLARAHLDRQVRDDETRRRLTPAYSFGCKRPTPSNDYLRTFNRDHVHLETEPIARVDEAGIVTADGRRTDLDVLLLCTGFDLWDTNFPAIDIVGRDGADLRTWWREERFQTYLGAAVPGFPNYLCVNSPYGYLGLSYFWTIEAWMGHVARLFTHLRSRAATVFEVDRAANDRYVATMRRRRRRSIFDGGDCASANSYYFDPNGEATLLRLSSVAAGMRASKRFPADAYRYR